MTYRRFDIQLHMNVCADFPNFCKFTVPLHTPVLMLMIQVFLVVTLSSIVIVYRRFERTYRFLLLKLLDHRKRSARKQEFCYRKLQINELRKTPFP